MLPYKNRLIKKGDFERVYKYGRFFYFGNIVLRVRENSLKNTRIGFSVGMQFSKKASERNKIKRRLRECFRSNIRKIKPGMDIAVAVKKSREELHWKKICEKIEKIIKKADLIIESER
jgi:ribonuclease P protein component